MSNDFFNWLLGVDATDAALSAAGDVPVVGILFKLWKVAASVPTYFFMKKVIRFLAELKDIPQEKRQAQVDKLESDPEQRKQFGETLLLILDKLDNMQKPAMVGRAFKALLKGDIHEKDFLAISHAIDLLSIGQIMDAARFYKSYGRGFIGRQGKPIDSELIGRTQEEKDDDLVSLQAMSLCGLVSTVWAAREGKMGPMVTNIKPETWYYTTRLGQSFYDIVLSK